MLLTLEFFSLVGYCHHRHRYTVVRSRGERMLSCYALDLRIGLSSSHSVVNLLLVARILTGAPVIRTHAFSEEFSPV